MPTSRIAFKYHYIQGDKIVHVGITYDIYRREVALKKELGSGHIKEIGTRTTVEKAKAWEREELKKYNLDPVS